MVAGVMPVYAYQLAGAATDSSPVAAVVSTVRAPAPPLKASASPTTQMTPMNSNSRLTGCTSPGMLRHLFPERALVSRGRALGVKLRPGEPRSARWRDQAAAVTRRRSARL